MWRSIVMATGISLGILGAEFMVVERMVLADAGRSSSRGSPTADYTTPTLSTWGNHVSRGQRRVLVPPEWAPWGFLSAGVLLILYGGSLNGPAGD